VLTAFIHLIHVTRNPGYKLYPLVSICIACRRYMHPVSTTKLSARRHVSTCIRIQVDYNLYPGYIYPGVSTALDLQPRSREWLDGCDLSMHPRWHGLIVNGDVIYARSSTGHADHRTCSVVIVASTFDDAAVRGIFRASRLTAFSWASSVIVCSTARCSTSTTTSSSSSTDGCGR